MKKLWPYIKGRTNSYFRKLKQDQIREFNARLEGLSLAQQLKVVYEEMDRWQERFKIRKYMRHARKVIINLDDLTDGFPSVRFWPMTSTVASTLPIHLHFVFQKEGRNYNLGTWTIDKTHR
jgi:hypothetical protein